MNLPNLQRAEKLIALKKRLFIGAYGFEDRTIGWLQYQSELTKGAILDSALMFNYDLSNDLHPSPNKTTLIQTLLKRLGCINGIQEIGYNWEMPNNIEDEIEDFFSRKLKSYEEIIVDISTMSKYLILICLLKLTEYNGSIRIVYSEASKYSPSYKEYLKSKDNMAFLAKYPSQGVAAIARARCLSSIRMQGQPVTLIAFTSFNEQLVRHLLGTMNPHRLILINGRPPDPKLKWRESATQEIHKKLIETFSIYNPLDKDNFMTNSISTLDYKETIDVVNKIYNEVGNYERIICGVTGSKMQTVGLYFSKILHPDIHLEYPTPSSYYVEGLSQGVKKIHELIIN
ncbi:hypothetical protein D2V93_02900 [Flagellimonas taeanensis]|nr:hypothetical protein D2V93_02900 [Allomuricauda taeanensis]